MDIPPEFLQVPHIPDLFSVPEQRFVNCHKAVLYIIDQITYDELTADPQPQRERGEDYDYSKRALAISEQPFVPVIDAGDLHNLAHTYDESVPYIGQIQDAADGYLAHSFLLARRDGDLICFDKEGFKEPYSFHTLEALLEKPNYQNQLWRFIQIGDVR